MSNLALPVTKGAEIPGGSLARNTALNFVAGAIPPIVGVITIPYIIRGFGIERFGVLSLSWAILVYFSMFDLGLGRATTKFVAEALGQGRIDLLSPIVWTALALQVLFGLLGGLILALVTPVLVTSALAIPGALAQEATYMFLVLSGSIPIVIWSVSMRGVLEASQRFDQVTLVRIPSNSLIFLAPAIALYLGLSLAGTACVILLAQLLTSLVYTVLAITSYPVLKQNLRISRTWVRPLLSYGGWVTLYNIIIPAVRYMDRFMLSSILSITVVGYYTIPYEMLTRLQIVPASIALTLFPAFSRLGASRKNDVDLLYTRCLKYLVLIMGPLTIMLVVHGEDILRAWLGRDLAQHMEFVFRLLAIGVFVNSLAWLPNTVLLGLGRADLVAKVFIIDLIIYFPIVFVMIRLHGIKGAAWAMLVRGLVEFATSFGLAWRMMALPRSLLLTHGTLRVVGLAGVLTVTMISLTTLSMSTWKGLVRPGVTIGCITVFVTVVWRYLLDFSDRLELIALARRMTPKRAIHRPDLALSTIGERCD